MRSEVKVKVNASAAAIVSGRTPNVTECSTCINRETRPVSCYGRHWHKRLRLITVWQETCGGH